MSVQQKLNLLRDELDSRQIVVRFEVSKSGAVIVHADYYADFLIAKAELRRLGYNAL